AARSREEVELREADLLKPIRWTLPESFSVSFGLARDPTTLWSPSVGVAPGTLLFARPTAVLPDSFRQQLVEFLADVAHLEPDVDVADVAYFVPGRSAAFTQFPSIQPKELTLTPTSSSASASLDPSDVLVSVTRGTVHLRSASTGRKIRLRTTGAANPDR